MADGNSIRVRLVTPEKIFVDGTAETVTLPARSGYLEVLYAHAPLLTELGAGEVRLRGGNVGDQQFFVAWGFAEVLPGRVTILADGAVRPSEIDLPEARAELERGQRLWSEAGEEASRYEEAERVIHEAEQRIAAAEAAGKSH
ncbi:MAG: ATP synthase F1 subunit epsilon [Acidobacteriaceae bacterium]